MEKVIVIDYMSHHCRIIKMVKIPFKNIIYIYYNNAINLLPDITIFKQEELFIKCGWYTCDINMDCML